MASPLLRYDLVTEPFPLQASVAPKPLQDEAQTAPADDEVAPPESLSAEAPSVAVLTIVASNPNPDPVKNPVIVKGVSITIPVGANATDLTNGDKLGPVAPDGWKLSDTKSGAGLIAFVFEPQDGHGAVGKQGLAFTFNTVTVNTQPGTAQLTLKEGSAGNPTTTLRVTKFPNGWGTVAFWLDPVNVPYGGSTTLNWDGPADATYTIQYALNGQVYNVPAQGEDPLGSNGKYPGDTDPPLKLSQSTIFTLSVEEKIGGRSYRAQEQKTATVQVPAPRIINFAPAPAIISADNPQPVRLKWETENASEISIGNVGNFSGAQAADGSASISPTVTPPAATVQYLATAYGLAGYSGPPALGQTSVLFNWSASSNWCAVWADNPKGGVFWSLKLWDGRDALDLSLVVTDNPSGQFREVYAGLPAGVVAADFGKQGVNTPASAWAQAQYGGLAGNRLYIGVGEYDSENTENVGQTWGLKFPDGRLVLLWYASGQSNGYIFSDSWQFTFGWTYYSNPMLRKGPHPQ